MRVAVDKGEPSALDLDHQLVARPEGVADIVELEVERRGLIGDKRLGRAIC